MVVITEYKSALVARQAPLHMSTACDGRGLVWVSAGLRGRAAGPGLPRIPRLVLGRPVCKVDKLAGPPPSAAARRVVPRQLVALLDVSTDRARHWSVRERCVLCSQCLTEVIALCQAWCIFRRYVGYDIWQ